jgi:flagellin
MPLRVNTNVPGINVQRHGRINNRNLGQRLERLSSGLRINRAADDAAGLSVSEGFRAEINGMMTGNRNTEAAINLIQTAEGALNEVSAMLIRMRELAVQSSNSTINNANREALNSEATQLSNEIDRIARVTSYNNQTVLSGFGNTADQDPTVSTALASPTTGVIAVSLSSASAGNYAFIDSDPSDHQITLGNGVATQTIDIGSALDTDGTGSGVVATGSSIVANFDRLGVTLTLGGNKPAEGINPATDGYRDGDLDGDLDGATLIVNQGTGGQFQIGPDDASSHRLEVNIRDMRASGAFLNLGSLSVAEQGAAQSAISTIDLAISDVSQVRGDLGAFQNRMAFSLRNQENSAENGSQSESGIRDADFATEVSEFTTAQILNQSSTAMLAQANALPQAALSLLG